MVKKIKANKEAFVVDFIADILKHDHSFQWRMSNQWSADQLQIEQQDYGISRTTKYRLLKHLAEAGLIEKTWNYGKSWRATDKLRAKFQPSTEK